ncbi:MAG: hypothetical protein L0Y72_14585 [Gemmataceae bacterium]|nr:hypothetical protein [Gemmataceae bacterium]MCI0740270.1 hypothetical protein [Gemmataceae bacterium]
MSDSFWEDYNHPLWQRKISEIKTLHDWRCDECGCTHKRLDVHHRWRESGRCGESAKRHWEYPNEAFACLCRDCHDQRTALDLKLKIAFGKLNYKEALKRLTVESEKSDYERTVFALRELHTNKVNGILTWCSETDSDWSNAFTFHDLLPRFIKLLEKEMTSTKS